MYPCLRFVYTNMSIASACTRARNRNVQPIHNAALCIFLLMWHKGGWINELIPFCNTCYTVNLSRTRSPYVCILYTNVLNHILHVSKYTTHKGCADLYALCSSTFFTYLPPNIAQIDKLVYICLAPPYIFIQNTLKNHITHVNSWLYRFEPIYVHYALLLFACLPPKLW